MKLNLYRGLAAIALEKKGRFIVILKAADTRITILAVLIDEN